MSMVQTAVKTDICAFSDYRIYPGRGIRYVARDSKNYIFISHKCIRLFLQKKKPASLRWTPTWRRLNKKGRARGETSKKKSKKPVKIQKAIAGMSVEDIQHRRMQAKQDSKPQEQALKEAKDRQRKNKAGHATAFVVEASKSQRHQPKIQKSAQKKR